MTLGRQLKALLTSDVGIFFGILAKLKIIFSLIESIKNRRLFLSTAVCSFIKPEILIDMCSSQQLHQIGGSNISVPHFLIRDFN